MKPQLPIPVELWDQIPPVAQAAILALVQQYEQRLQQLQDQVEDLRQRLGQNSANSSRPPSTDPPAVKRNPPRPPSGRATGGQPGHALQQRPLLPPDDTIPCKPTACRLCGWALQGHDPQPLRHQVIKLPPIRPAVTEYQLHRLACPCCGITTCAALPRRRAGRRAGPTSPGDAGLVDGGLSAQQAHGRGPMCRRAAGSDLGGPDLRPGGRDGSRHRPGRRGVARLCQDSGR